MSRDKWFADNEDLADQVIRLRRTIATAALLISFDSTGFESAAKSREVRMERKDLREMLRQDIQS